MRHRVAEIIGNRARIMWVSTFHSACVRILRADIHRFGYARQFSIYDDADSKRLMQLVCGDLGLDPKKHPVRQVLNWVSNCKNDLVDHEAAQARGGVGQELYPEAYADYQRRLRAANALDFDDLIMLTVHLFQAFPEVLEHYRRRFRHVLVDEYQDTNHAQYALIRELCGAPETEDSGFRMVPEAFGTDPPELMVVGDSDQSIYAFRGATIRNILDFATDFPGARTVMLEQNYRSTQTVLSAANAVIAHNEGRPAKNLWSAAGDGDRIVGYVADTEHDEAQFVAGEIEDLAAAGTSGYADTAVFYRTNAQSRAFEEVFIRRGVPYKVVGGVRFYERKEVRDVIAYLRAIVNRADDVSVRRILNVPKRGIGDRSEAAIEAFAQREGITFSDAVRRASESGLAAGAVRRLRAFADMMDEHEEMVASGTPAHEVVASVLDASGYLAELEASSDPQDQTRVENLAEFLAVAEEFVTSASAVSLDETDPGFDLETAEGVLLGAPEPDPSLAAFLERIALVADADQLGAAGQGASAEGDTSGVVTLMTLHTAKGLEFDTVFLTGCEDGILPHQRTLTDIEQLAEERRLAYVGITRARKRLYLSRAVSRSAWGAPQHNPPSRFLTEIPDRLMDWRRLGSAQTTWRNTSATARYRERVKRDGFGTRIDTVPVKRDVPQLSVGDRVLHNAFGLGTVVALHGSGPKAMADVDFGSTGVKRLALQFAPLEKL